MFTKIIGCILVVLFICAIGMAVVRFVQHFVKVYKRKHPKKVEQAPPVQKDLEEGGQGDNVE